MPKVKKMKGMKKSQGSGQMFGKKGKKAKRRKLKASAGGGVTAPSSTAGTQYKPAKGDRSHEDSTYKLQQSHFTRLAGDYNADRIRDLGEAGTYYGTLATPAQAAQYKNVTTNKLTGYKKVAAKSKKNIIGGKASAALRKLQKKKFKNNKVRKGGLG